MNRQHGMAIITVLLIITLMTLFAVAGQRLWKQSFTRADTQHYQQQLKWTLLGAEKWLLSQSSLLKDNAAQQLQLDEQIVGYRWRDQQHCLNLNALGQNSRVDNQGQVHLTVAQQIFAQLLQQQGMRENDISALIAQIHAQLNARGTNQWPLLADKTEIRHLPLLAEPQWSRLAPYLCALPQNTLHINLNALNPDQAELLVALLQGKINREQGISLLQNRPEQGWEILDAFFAVLPGDAESAASTLQSVAVLESRHWELLMWHASHSQFAAMRSQWIRENGVFTLQYRQYGLSEAP